MSQQVTEQEQAMPALSFEAYKVLVPSAAGLAMASCAINLAVQQAHQTTGVSTFSGWVAIAAGVLFSALFVLTLFVKRFDKKAIYYSTFVAIHLAGLSALALAFTAAIGAPVPAIATFLLQTGTMVGNTLVMFYWLRKLRGTSAQAIAVVAFCALGASEFVTFVFSFFGEFVWYLCAFVLAFAQFATTNASRKLDTPSDVFPAVSELYFGTDENRFSNRFFLVIAAIGIWFISIPIGMGRGFSTGDPIHMSLVPRFLVTLFTCIVCAMWVRAGLASRMRTLTTSIWVALGVLLGLAAVFFAVWPLTISMGESFVMAASLVLNAFVWYMTIAFISFGWRDPYYYASAAWVAVKLLTVLGMKLDSWITQLMPSNTPVIISIMSFFALIATQVVFTRLLAAPSEASQAQAAAQAQANNQATAPNVVTQDDVRKIPLMGVLAISPQEATPLPSNVPNVHVAQSVIQMGETFGLSGREVEVCTLYALGHTQQHISEELCLSTNTVHTHIKRIYKKTDLHSRQEILDYINDYGA